MSMANKPDSTKENGASSTEEGKDLGGCSSSSSSSDEMIAYKKNVLSVVSFKLVYERDDLHSKDAVTFKPNMAHQIFGESESIFGYRNVSVTLHYLHNSSQCYVDIKTSGKLKKKDIEVDDILEKMNPWLPSHYVTKESEFLALLEKEKHDEMFGEVIGSFRGTTEVKQFSGRHPPVYATYLVTQNDVSNENFKDFHSRFETFIVWYIDAANYIELDDPRWLIYYLYEKFEHPETKKIYRTPVAFCTIYKFFAYPNKIRARISQIFMLPPHQKRGVGRRFYSIVAKTVRGMADVVDITTEDPTAAFQKIRDIDDCLLMYNEFKEKNLKMLSTNFKTISALMREKKICKKRCQRVYDILAGAFAKNKGLSEYRTFVNRIKQRIKEENEREYRPGKRFCGLQKSLLPVDIEVQIETQHKKYIEEIEPSITVLKRLL